MKRILYIIGIAAVLASCSKEHEEMGGGSYDRVPIEFSSSIEATSRAVGDTDTQFSDGEKIGIIGCRADAAGATTDFSTTTFLDKIEFNYNSGKFTPTTTTPAAYWQLDKVHNFYAYYPSTLNITTSGSSITSTLSVENGEQGIANDVMHAKVENTVKFTGTAGNTALLAFEHKLSKVRFRVLKEKSADSNPVLNKVEFTMAKNQGTYNVATGAVTNLAGGSAALSKTMGQTVTETTATDVNAEWTVLPGDALIGIYLTIGTQKLAATIAGGEITTTAGKITVITLTIKTSGIEFTSASLEDWGTAIGSGEVGPPLPQVGDYYYSDGSFSKVFSVPSGATLLGVVYKVNGKKGMLVEVTEGNGEWGGIGITYAINTTDGQANMETIKALDPDYVYYPAFKRCAVKNAGGATDWYLPAGDELHALYTAYNSYGKTAFNTLMTASGVNGTEIGIDYYWSSSEYDTKNSICVIFNDNSTSHNQKINSHPMRCVRAF